MARQTLAERKRALEAELSEIDSQLAAENAERLTLIGEAIAAEMKTDPAFKDTINALLDRRVKAKRKRALLSLPPVPRETAA